MINLLLPICLRKEILGYSSPSILPCISGPRKTENYLLPRTLQLCNHLNDCLYYEWRYDAVCALSYHKAFAQFAYCGWLEHISFISWKTAIQGLADLHKQWASQPLATFVCHFLSFTGWLQVPETYVPTARKSTKWKTM